jgi:SAM-dependent methyltransferase
LAWDCATGNGQAAIGLVPFFKNVIATDASPKQLEFAIKNPAITYRTELAEKNGLKSHSVDLVTVATAIHWLDTEIFYPEVRRIVKPGGVIAVWLYSHCLIDNEIDSLSKVYSEDIVGKYWPIENRKAWNFEKSVDFPFEKIKTPEFLLKVKWDLDEYLKYLYTWSSTQNYIAETGKDPIKEMLNDFRDIWKDENEKKEVTWKLEMKAGRV